MSATLLPNAEQMFIDGNGVPLAAGKVYTYIPGTTSFKTTWQDAAQTIPNSNPIILDAAGRAIIFGRGQYRQVVKDSLGNLIWDQLTADTGLVYGTSTGQQNVITGPGTIDTQAGLNFVPGQFIAIVNSSNPAIYLLVIVTQYVAATGGLAYQAVEVNGSGIQPGSWNITYDGLIGAFTGSGGIVSLANGGTGSVLNNAGGQNYVIQQAAFGANFTSAPFNAVQLGDYANFTWVPEVTFATPGDLAVTYSTQSGTTYKIGPLTFIACEIVTSSFTFTTASGNLQVIGIPIGSANIPDLTARGATTWQGITKAGYTDICMTLPENSVIANLVASGSGLANSYVTAANTPSGGNLVIRSSFCYQVDV